MKPLKKRAIAVILLILFSISVLAGCALETPVTGGDAEWVEYVTICEPEIFASVGKDARNIEPGRFGAQYARMAELENGDWIVVYTVYENNGYLSDPQGGTTLEIALSKDNCRTWEVISTITEPGRDLDNGQIKVLKNGELLLACRSVRWQESYKIDVYKSTDRGATWSYLSTVDENHGLPGELGNPDKGVYEPHIDYISENELAVFYASEIHVTGDIPYSQIISEKISTDNGETWSEEIFVAWDSKRPYARPGMPVFTKMGNGEFIVVFEDGIDDNFRIHYKISPDGKTWEEGLGTRIPDHIGAPYITKLSNDRLLLISNSHVVSYSDDHGQTWVTNAEVPWLGAFPNYCWPSCYQTGKNEIALITSVPRRGA